jgi:UDP-3-O-[3-hydroxymyristoyl] N-acetylglucosamine deacetylase
MAVCDTRMATTISPGGDPGAPKVQTIEHLMSACAGLGLDNLIMDITAEEVPILDGSAAASFSCCKAPASKCSERPSVLAGEEAGGGPRRRGPSLKWALLEPFHGYKLTFEIEFDHPAVNATGQRVEFDMGSGRYKRDIARARTFGFTKDVELMRSRGLGLGGSMDNVIVVDDCACSTPMACATTTNSQSTRCSTPSATCTCAGKPMLAHYTCLQERPRAEQQAAACAAGRRDAYDIVTFEDESKAPAGLAALAPAW